MKNRGEGLRKSIVSVILAVFMIFSMIAHAGTLSAMDQTSFYGIRPDITYTEDATSAIITINTAGVKSEEIEVKEILDHENNPLNLSNPQISVTQNGEYAFTIRYCEKKVVAEDSVNEENQGNNQKAESENPVEQNTGSTENVAEESGSTLNDEVKSFVMNAKVDGIKALNTNANSIEESESDSVDSKKNTVETTQPEVTAAAESRNVPSNSKLGEIFDLSQLQTLKGTPIANDTTSWHPSIEGNKIIGYDARGTTSMPDSETTGTGRWQASTVLPAKNKVSLRQNWEFKGKGILPVAFPNSAMGVNYSAAIIISDGSWIDNKSGELALLGLDVASSTSSVDFYVRNRGTAFTKTAGTMTPSADMAIKYTYGSGKSGKFTIEYAGKTASFTVDNLPETADLLLYTQLQYGSGTSETQNDFPKIRAGFEFGEFGYRDYDPQLLGAEWRDASGKVLEDGSVVKGGDTLTVEATMKNNTTSNGNANVILKLSDDSTIASTHGVEPNADITNGIAVTLSKDTVTKEFTVTVREDAIGNISLGLMMEDDFFHNKQYVQLKSKIDVGQVFVDGTPKVEVVEAKRDPISGKMIGTAAGEPSFKNSTDQDSLNQDSYVRVTVNMVNPRKDVALQAKVSLNTENAAGLDFDHVYAVDGEGLDTLTVNDVKTMLSTGKTLDYEVPPNGESHFTFVVPVKQNSTGAPFSTAEQKIEAVVEGTITLGGSSATGEWRREVKISDTIIDIDSWLNMNAIGKGRGVDYNLWGDIEAAFRTKHSSSKFDSATVTTRNKGTADDWKYFGLDSETDLAGVIPYFTDDDKTMEIVVSYNKSVLINDEQHWTRDGSGLNAPFRTRDTTIKFTVSGGTVMPTAYFEIPKMVHLDDQKGIDDDHAGMKAEISLVAGVETKESFTVIADDKFSISNGSGQEHIVSLYDASGTAYAASGLNKVLIGTFNNVNRTKTVWYDLKKEYLREPSYYSGTMNFYITMN